jgi:hypothetical protein
VSEQTSLFSRRISLTRVATLVTYGGMLFEPVLDMKS